MSQTKQIWTILLAACLFSQALIVPVATAPFSEKSKELEARQVPLTPSQFSLAATRFIVLLPFLPLLMFVPGMTGVLMPMFLALQDRLQTIAPNLNVSIFGIRPNNNNNAGVGSVSNQGVTVSVATTEAPSSTTPTNTYYRFKRSLWKPKLPTKEITETFKEVKNFLSMADGIFNLVTSSQPDCRRQAVCRLHHALDPSLGKILGNVFEVLKLESKVEKLEVSDTTRSIIKDALRAANTGLFRQDCSSVYSRCSIVLSSRKP